MLVDMIEYPSLLVSHQFGFLVLTWGAGALLRNFKKVQSAPASCPVASLTGLELIASHKASYSAVRTCHCIPAVPDGKYCDLFVVRKSS